MPPFKNREVPASVALHQLSITSAMAGKLERLSHSRAGAAVPSTVQFSLPRAPLPRSHLGYTSRSLCGNVCMS